MSKDGDLLDGVVARLRQVRERLGPDVYLASVRAALHAIAVAVLDEAERRARVDCVSGGILQFPWGIWQEQGNYSSKSNHDRIGSI